MAIIVSAMTNWPCKMVVQWHLQLLENIVVPHHLTSSQRAMRYWFILLQILGASQILDSSWCTIQVINTVQIGLKFLATQSFLGLPFTIYVHRVLALCDFWKWEKNRISQKLHYAKIFGLCDFWQIYFISGIRLLRFWGYFISVIFDQSQ